MRIASYVPTVGRASGCCLAFFVFCCFVAGGYAAEIHSEDFDASDGGYTEMLFDPLGAATPGGPWTWGAGGVDGSNAWNAEGAEGGSPFEQLLNSPPISIPDSGLVTLDFDHSYAFEATWDGGVVMFSVNGAPMQQVTGFTQNGYNDLMQTGSDWGYEGDMNGLEMFGIDSGGFIHSTANLGTMNAGDTLEIQFRGGWDWGTLVPGGWTIDNVLVTQFDVPGDFNFDGNLDLVDFRIMADNFNEPGRFADGDMNIDGAVNMADFVEWYQAFSTQGQAAVAAVPEPGSPILWVLGSIALCLWQRRRAN